MLVGYPGPKTKKTYCAGVAKGSRALRYDETTIREEFNKLSLQEYGNSSIKIAMALVLKRRIVGTTIPQGPSTASWMRTLISKPI
jgi:hypothetical protein